MKYIILRPEIKFVYENKGKPKIATDHYPNTKGITDNLPVTRDALTGNNII